MCHRCPECGRAFETEQGLGVHREMAHDARPPNRECDYCGERFHCAADLKYCCSECRDAAVGGDEQPLHLG